ncbi:MAG: ribose 5-phosphate isomerase B [Candidatus Aminicenantes bacterium RBG_16_63_16]|nr:MAG: ribose 5-phosphate isomerase B [Candidatus Aminicenantes bacterium RBG_16_63_16]
MKLALAADHAGFELKSAIADHLGRRGIDFEDLGCGPGETVDYVDYAARAAGSVVSGACDRAILFCGTGIGMAVVANKFKGIRATPSWNLYTASISRRHNDSNCLALGGRVLTREEAVAIVEAWLEAPFEGGRHARRVDKIVALENANFKNGNRRTRHVPTER